MVVFEPLALSVTTVVSPGKLQPNTECGKRVKCIALCALEATVPISQADDDLCSGQSLSCRPLLVWFQTTA